MRNKKMMLGVTAALLMIALSSSAFALGNIPRARNQKKIHTRIERHLNLSDEQKAKFKDEEKRSREEMKPDRGQLKKFSDQLKEELTKDEPDHNRIHDHINKMGQLRTRMEIKRMDSLLKLRKLLTPEQREKFKKMSKAGRQRKWNKSR